MIVLYLKVRLNRSLSEVKHARLRSIALYSALLLAGSALSACVPQPSTPAPGVVGDGQFRAIIEKVVRDNNIPAMSVVVMQEKQVLESAAVGLRSLNQTVPIQEEDQWQIGSVTKAVTATLAAKLVDIGMLRWDTRIEESFSEHLAQIENSLFDITLAELLQHKSGLARHPVPSNEEKTDNDRLAFVLRVMSSGPVSERGEFAYSNLGYLIAGVMIEKATSLSWEAAVDTYLFSELGIVDYGFGVPNPSNDLSQPIGHLLRTSTSNNRVNDYWLPIAPNDDEFLKQLQLYGPSGSIYLSKQEYYKFQQLHLDGANANSDFLSQSSFDRLHKPDNGYEYAMGWFNEESEIFSELNLLDSERLLAHGGNTAMWSALSALLPNRDTSIFIASNSDNDVRIDVLELILKRLEVIQP
jgi:CubicO group peptidase (beta-lactamase class C family)